MVAFLPLFAVLLCCVTVHSVDQLECGKTVSLSFALSDAQHAQYQANVTSFRWLLVRASANHSSDATTLLKNQTGVVAELGATMYPKLHLPWTIGRPLPAHVLAAFAGDARRLAHVVVVESHSGRIVNRPSGGHWTEFSLHCCSPLCADGEQCNELNHCETPPPCVVGSEECACGALDRCDAGLECVAQRCFKKPPPHPLCVDGVLGCACRQSVTAPCNDAEHVVCREHLGEAKCVSKGGALGAACNDAFPCQGDLRCVDQTCVTDDPHDDPFTNCQTSELGCPCPQEAFCNDPLLVCKERAGLRECVAHGDVHEPCNVHFVCQSPLECRDGRCSVQCTPGTLGCSCKPTPHHGNIDCEVPLTCQRGICASSSKALTPAPSDTCHTCHASQLCIHGRCVDYQPNALRRVAAHPVSLGARDTQSASRLLGMLVLSFVLLSVV